MEATVGSGSGVGVGVGVRSGHGRRLFNLQEESFHLQLGFSAASAAVRQLTRVLGSLVSYYVTWQVGSPTATPKSRTRSSAGNSDSFVGLPAGQSNKCAKKGNKQRAWPSRRVMKLPGWMSQVQAVPAPRSSLLTDHMMLSGPGLKPLAALWPGRVYLAEKGYKNKDK